MAFAALCDMCGEEPAQFMVTNVDTGSTNTWGLGCFGLVGLTTFLQGDPAYLDGVLKERGYAPNKAEKDARKAAAAEPDLSDRTIAEIVESGPRPIGVDNSNVDESVNADDRGLDLVGDDEPPPSPNVADQGGAPGGVAGSAGRPDHDDPAPY